MSLEGHLEDLSLADIFQIIHLSKKTGVLTVENASSKGRIVFHDGQILYASLQNQERLGERLLKEGLIKEKDIEAALRIQKERKVHEPLGAILAENRLIDKNVLEEILREQLHEVIYELLSWDDGRFKFEPEKTNQETLPGGSVSPEYLLLEGTRLRDESSRVPGDIKEAGHSAKTITKENGISSSVSTLISLIEELSITTVSTEALLMILRFAGEVMNRAVLFILREGCAEGFGQVGLSAGSSDQRVKNLKVPLKKTSVIGDAVLSKAVYKGPLPEADWNNYLITHIGEGAPEEVFVAPVTEGDRVIAVVYGDNLPNREPIGDTSALEAFIKVAGFVNIVSKSPLPPSTPLRASLTLSPEGRGKGAGHK